MGQEERLSAYLEMVVRKATSLRKSVSKNLLYSAKVIFNDGSKNIIPEEASKMFRRTITQLIDGQGIKRIEVSFTNDGKKVDAPKPFIGSDDDDNNQFKGFKGTDDLLGQLEIRATEVAEKRMAQIYAEKEQAQFKIDFAELKEKNAALQKENEKLSGELETVTGTHNQLKLFSGILGTIGAGQIGAKLDEIALGFLPDKNQPKQLAENTKRVVQDNDLEEDETIMDSDRAKALKRINNFMISLTPADLASAYDLLCILQDDTTKIKKCFNYIQNENNA